MGVVEVNRKPKKTVKQCLTEAADQHTDNVICSGEHTHSWCHCVSDRLLETLLDAFEILSLCFIQ